MEDMERTSVIDIPELVSIIASYLSPHDLTFCVRVNSTWANNLRPFLYENIKVVDFDLYSHRTRRAMRFPLPDLWSNTCAAGETRSKEMNLLNFKMFHGQDNDEPTREDAAKDIGGNTKPQLHSHPSREQGRSQEWARVQTRAQELPKDDADSATQTRTTTTMESKDEKDTPMLLFPNLLQSPLTLDADLTRPTGSYSKAAEMFQRPVGYGGHYVQKYGQFIRTLTVAHPHSLIYVGKHCRNLVELSVYNWMSLDKLCRLQLEPKLAERWHNFWISRNQEKMLQIWIQVLERNPCLKVVRLELSLVPIGGLTRLAMVLSKLEHLQEIEVFDSGVDRRVEVILDHCPSIKKLTWTKIEGKSKVALGRTYGERQKQNASLFGRTRIWRGYLNEQPQGEEELGGNSRPTGIQDLDLHGLSLMPEANIRRLMARMPQLKSLRGPKCYRTLRALAHAVSSLTTEAGAPLCPLLERLELTCTQRLETVPVSDLISQFRKCINFTRLRFFNMPESESELPATGWPVVEFGSASVVKGREPVLDRIGITEEERAAIQMHIFNHLMPLVRLEKLHLCKGMWNEKQPNFSFVMDPEAAKQLQRLRWLNELLVHNVRHALG
ncbi:hypothetical protein EMPS_08888 [Entomortierella parvispora]|uniref:F-box domain-containing protein n=1 Tax=Entomortierella parvispora TaxID=205924 RepID=A0A9P3HGY8_9FUNG|nr:hypothetical protein EMPS_08888 [Entomortierella parvispora]